jgi:hypothetical protein
MMNKMMDTNSLMAFFKYLIPGRIVSIQTPHGETLAVILQVHIGHMYKGLHDKILLFKGVK